MRIDHQSTGKPAEPRALDAGSSSFGRIARRRAAPPATPPVSMQLHAAARADRARRLGDLVANTARALVARVHHTLRLD